MKTYRETVYDFMVALASNPDAVDAEDSFKNNADYVLTMAISLADKFEASEMPPRKAAE